MKLGPRIMPDGSACRSDRFRVIPNGFDLPDLPLNSRSTMRECSAFTTMRWWSASIMGFREEKRPLLWIEMARLLHRAHPQLRFVIFGDGDLLPACHALVEAEDLAGVIALPGETRIRGQRCRQWTSLC